MTETSRAVDQWSIGELAKACGVTVRTLHHYDEIGLLPASQRTDSGHRRYTGQDVRRLYRIRALQMIGLPLTDIAATLESPSDDLASMRKVLESQLMHMRRQAEQIQTAQDRILDLLSRIDVAAMPSTEQFMSTLEMITVLANHFTPEQRQELADRRAELGVSSIETAKIRWVALVEEGLRYVSDGTPASDPLVREWARAWDELGSMFHSGEQTKTAARAMWQENAASLGAGLPWSTEQMAALLVYLEKARTQP